MNNIKEEKEYRLELTYYINWDTTYSPTEILDIIDNKEDYSNTRLNFFVKSLETFSWNNLITLWGMEECNRLYTDKVRRMIFSDFLKEQYDGVFNLLRNKTLSFTGRSSEEIEKLRATLLFNRRNRCKQRVFTSPLLRRP